MSTPGFNWRDSLHAGFQGLAGAAGNQDLYDQIQQHRDQKQQAALQMQQLSLSKVGQAQQKVTDMLVSGTHPETGAPLSQMERANLSQTYQTLNDYAHQIATGQPPPKQSAPPPAPTTTTTPDENLGGNVLPGKTTTVAQMTPEQSVQHARDAIHQFTANIPANPYAQKYNQVRSAFPDVAPEEAMHLALGTAPKELKDKMIAQWEAAGDTPEQALQRWARSNALPGSEKAPKGLKPIEGGIGIKDEDTGQSYFPSQINDPSIPPAAKDMLVAQKAAKEQKVDDEDRKENLRLNMQARTLGAAFERMGMQQQFQESMANFRSDLTTYRALDKQADESGSIVQGLKEQYKQPGNKAVADNELQNFYTTVVQKGGRKTAAELQLTAKIGSFGMNIDQMLEKAKSGQLPDPLRRELLSGMDAVAKEQRREADSAKPELPELPTRGGKKKSAPAASSKDPLGVL